MGWNMKVIDGFGNKLKTLRDKAGLTQQQLAVQMGLSKSTISQYENQERIPSPIAVIKLASVFHVSIDYLFGIDKVERADLTGLTEDDIMIIEHLIVSMREKNEKIRRL